MTRRADAVGVESALVFRKDPTTAKVFPGGIIPVSRLDPVAQNIIRTIVPLPNNAGGTSYSDSEAAPATDDQGMPRVDHQLTASNRLAGDFAD